MRPDTIISRPTAQWIPEQGYFAVFSALFDFLKFPAVFALVVFF